MKQLKKKYAKVLSRRVHANIPTWKIHASNMHSLAVFDAITLHAWDFVVNHNNNLHQYLDGCFNLCKIDAVPFSYSAHAEHSQINDRLRFILFLSPPPTAFTLSFSRNLATVVMEIVSLSRYLPVIVRVSLFLCRLELPADLLVSQPKIGEMEKERRKKTRADV